MSEPYTHAMHAAECGQAARLGQWLAERPVQVRMGPVVRCAVILDAWTTADGQDMWKLRIDGYGIGSFPVYRVRACGQVDARCVCEPAYCPLSQGLAAGCAERATRAPQPGWRP